MTVATTSNETIERITHALIERGFNHGDFGGLEAVVAPDMIEHQDGASSGIDGVRALITELRTSIPDLHLELQDSATVGDTTWLRFRSTGTNDGPMFGRPPTGRPIDITVMDVVRVVDGKIVEHWGVADRLAVLKQIGAMGRGGGGN
jgi:predicted ester cyclase